MPPRASVRQRNATPARATRSSTALPQETPTTRRSTRAASRAPAAAENVSNPALPEIRTQQSYAYGASKTPALPEQLHVKDSSMSMAAVANRLTAATEKASQNFAAQAEAAMPRESSPASQAASRDERARRRSQEPTRPTSPPLPEAQPTPDAVVRENRTAAWVSDSQLDDIDEESIDDKDLDRGTQTPARQRDGSLPSSFPSGSFTHSYNYERGIREPRLPQPNREPSQLRDIPRVGTPARQTVIHRNSPQRPATRVSQSLSTQARQAGWNVFTSMANGWKTFSAFIIRIATAAWDWTFRMLLTVRKSVSELPDTPAMDWLIKSLVMGLILTSTSMLFCMAFTRICDPTSPSVVTQQLQKFCGRCSASTLPPFDLSNTNSSDVQSLLTALRHTQLQIQMMESRLNSRIDSSLSPHIADTATLRKQQNALELQIRRLSQHSGLTAPEVSSPLIPKINFFSPTNGAVVIPFLTSPTRSSDSALSRLAYRLFRVQKTISAPPITALTPWQDDGECWCAADTSDDQDSVRLAVQTSQKIFPTELVIEHFPTSGSLQPGTAPKDMELWADFSGLSFEEWERLHIRELVDASPQEFKVTKLRSWARIGTAMYMSNTEDDARTSHVQRFNLEVNQQGLIHYTDRFLLRVRNNYGAKHTCLYRVRLHGLPFGSDS